MAYEPKPMGARLGIHADKIDAIREERGLTPAGFRQDGTDALKSDKESMTRELYRHADAHLPAGLVVAPAPVSEAEGEQENDDMEAP